MPGEENKQMALSPGALKFRDISLTTLKMCLDQMYLVCSVMYHAAIGISRYFTFSYCFQFYFRLKMFYWNFNNFNKESLKACICKLPLVKVLQRKCQICPVQKCFFVFIFSYQDYLQRLKSFQTSNVLKMN